MALTKEQRLFLKDAGIEIVRIKLLNYAQTGSQGMVGFAPDMMIARIDIEEWVSEKTRDEEKQQARTLRWAMIAGLAATAGLILGAMALLKS
jgi:hypothetical protein